MRIASAEVLGSHLRPLCSRDNRLMKYESAGSKANTGDQASYHCGFEGCSVRYDATDGYHMLIGMPGRAKAVDEPGVNTLKCPIHGRWLYRQQSIETEPSVGWRCGVKDCHYGYLAETKGDWVRT
jgi:hypothetical protein